jgi:hypothetical protein|tara:strand:- start:451 stop:1467 length:1017 start_codon:yes stop_codon:yes gene_type:complete
VSEDETPPPSTLDAVKTVLWAQVRKAKDEFGIEMNGETGILRPANHPSAVGSIILGDVMAMLMRVFGAHAPPRIVELPGFDEQRWKIEFGDEVVWVEVESRPYWGFGLLASSFLNHIVIKGPLERRCRLVLDLSSAMGRPLWEPVRRKKWFKVTGLDIESHSEEWNRHMNQCRTALRIEIEKRESRILEMKKKLDGLDKDAFPDFNRRSAAAAVERALRDVDVSSKALHEDNAAALERAFARIDTALIEADPEKEVGHQIFEEEDEEVIMHAVSAEDVEFEEVFASAPVLEEFGDSVAEADESLPQETGAEAEDLLTDEKGDSEDEIPFIDLTIDGEE